MFCCSSSMTDYAMMKEYGKERVGLVLVCGVTSKPPSIIPSLPLFTFYLLFKQKTICAWITMLEGVGKQGGANFF